MFSSNLTTPGVSFAAVLRGGVAQQQQPLARQVPGAIPPPAEVKLSTPAIGHQQKAGQSIRAPTVSSQLLDNVLILVTAVQKIMTEFNGAVSEEENIVAITKIVLNLMKQDGR
jgi:hypothetical protein